MTGSIWDEDRYWTQGVSANERHYFTTWEKPSAQLPEDLTNVYLGANGFGNDETSFSIEYKSAKLGEAKEEIKDMLSDVLTATSTTMVTCRNACSPLVMQ